MSAQDRPALQLVADFEAPLPFGDEPIRCESVAEEVTTPPATMGEWIARAHRTAAKRREARS